MAGDWIKMRVDLRDDPAVFAIAEKLGVDELHAVGALFSFWVWADKHSVDGRVDGATSRLVDKVSRTDGLASALAQVGWLVIDDAGITIPNFQRHNGESAKERGQKNARQARWRAKKDASVDDKASTQPSTKASTREEKRREEKSISPDGDISAPGKPAALRASDLVALGVSANIAEEYMAVRKRKRAGNLPESSLSSIQSEAAIAGYSLEQALIKCVSRNWVAFEAAWVRNDKPTTGATLADHNRAVAAEALRRANERNLTGAPNA